MTPEQNHAYAVGYWMGRAIGSDEGWNREAERHGWDTGGAERAAFKAGYERGVVEYVEYDEDGDPNDPTPDDEDDSIILPYPGDAFPLRFDG